MNILVIVSSKHGGTTGIAEEIQSALTDAHHTVELRNTSDRVDVHGYGAVFVGSAVYFGHWRKDAVRFLDRNSEALAALPVWLFSSGPVGKTPGDQPLDLENNMKLSQARGHCLFDGKLESTNLGPVEQLVTRALHAESGDWRNWDAIRAWATDIGEGLDNRPAQL